MTDFGYVLATKMLVDGKRKVRFMYREEGEDGDSGWRFFCGDESQAYADDPDNIEIYDVATVLAIDESVAPYLGSAVGSAFEREDENSDFTAVEFGFSAEVG